MTDSEKTTQNRILLALSRGATRLFRCNTGQGWAGRAEKITAPRTVTVGPGDVIVRKARPLRAGLTTGGSDLIGWRAVKITPEHVGQTLAVFAAIEVKSATGRVSPGQAVFLDAVRAAGGLSGAAWDVDDATEIIESRDGAPYDSA